ncbi:uncharacterized protein LOC131323236 [Rhododendron vialii]|uniref:uncharacterized protein LOC131323236 n=1 Tax=Rhododendron vialii TaxID=182163 RepID=UPI00265D89F1|nr:uncharacterized protein LOC131323236 [Rhododendron vialii]
MVLIQQTRILNFLTRVMKGRWKVLTGLIMARMNKKMKRKRKRKTKKVVASRNVEDDRAGLQGKHNTNFSIGSSKYQLLVRKELVIPCLQNKGKLRCSPLRPITSDRCP